MSVPPPEFATVNVLLGGFEPRIARGLREVLFRRIVGWPEGAPLIVRLTLIVRGLFDALGSETLIVAE